MLYLTEKQRREALEICERIEQANEKLQRHAKAALDALEVLKKSCPAPTEGPSR